MADVGRAITSTAAPRARRPTLPEAQELLELLEDWRRTADPSTARGDLEQDAGDLHRPGVLDRHRDQHAAAGRRRRRLQNVPDKALYSWDPTAYFGVYLPDTFLFDAEELSRCCATSSGASLVMIPTLLIISVLVFTIIELPPGDYFESYIAELQARARAST